MDFQIKNIFLSGEKGIGKSTILDKLIMHQEKQITGFKTFADPDKQTRTFFIKPINIESNIKQEQNCIGYCINGKKFGVTTSFENLGVKILNDSMENNSSLVVMDELGFFESQAQGFQKKVFEILSGPQNVLGVLKNQSLPFLESIKSRKDVVVIKVTKENRNRITDIILEKYL